MKQEEKELLLKDLSARLPYGVKVQFKLPDYKNDVFTEETGELQSISKCGEVSINSKGIDYRFIQLDCKPYLRPMSSMTDEENYEFRLLPLRHYESYDWLNSHHFDWRGLIPKGLAIEAGEDMYA